MFIDNIIFFTLPTHSLATSRAEGADRLSRNLVIAVGVVLFHLVGLWALQSGLLRRAVEIVVPAQILSELIEPPAPKVDPPPPPPPPPPQVKQPVVKTLTPPLPTPAPAPAPVPMAIADPAPAPAAPVGTNTPQAALPPITAPVAAVAEPLPPPAPPAPARVELPTSEAEYLHNPKPVYPRISKHQGEQGKVVYRMNVGADGLPKSADLVKSSGFERLDQAAYKTVMSWRYAPGKRNGVPIAMSYDQVVTFVLD